ncbi:GTP 3',8-cyclase MoaA [Gordonia sp. Z-3]|jgi:cyclic pyranopterin phosphate synthase|uniref:GTP 3',8-cyclase n=1 Tax=Gordonia tangerina TaxID=2911060 RepID=A0ABS9DQX1_9ACTN|nr:MULTISPECIES: GTP 3',8-cyclase MoaA [Gordonia]MAU84845.1 GTP 3',8-cyclase MoaA [Gordonia sp. (in: high G+C Gram-positive bacteria)]MCF3941002.1 GTP 3',8-cyclase MoaA [Gordonia tangerina]MED5800057.1 GTP 3',8-cyclase MoaA [Gordonia sp. Z-3]
MTIVGLGLPTTPSDRVEPTDAPTTGPLRDRFGRVATDLRVSVTDRCNLRCTYCMPAEGLDWLPTDEVLRTDELIRVMTVGVRDLGIRSIRFTGGEPLLRRDLEDLISAMSARPERPEIAMTTNGLGLARRIDGLVAAGLDRVNISLDTVDATRFAEITRRDRLHDVLAGLAAARSSGLSSVKVNAVLADHDDLTRLPQLAHFCLDHGYQLRIIEQMPLDADHRWDRASMVTADEILAKLRAHFSLRPDPRPRGSAPAATWLVDGFDVDGSPARIGVIASVTRPFCGDCDRTRLTADGALRNCLFAQGETDLREIVRGGLTGHDLDDALARRWRGNTWAKSAGHGVNDPGFLQPSRPMSAIGG